MKEEKYRKALRAHNEKIGDFAMELHELVDGFLDDECSIAEVVGMLETEKSFRIYSACEEASHPPAVTSCTIDEIEEFLDALGRGSDD